LSLLAGAFVLAAAFVTATVSGVLGMAGGLLLMGALLLVLPATTAFVAHGVLQLVSNGWRVVLHRRHVSWGVLGWYAVGSATAAATLTAVRYAPSTPLTYLFLGLVPMLVWLPRGVLRLDASRPAHAVAAGLAVTSVNLVAGVAGPLLDVFFVRTSLGRHAVVATKAATQVLSHTAKVLLYGGALLSGGADLPWLVLLLAVPLSMLGTVVGGRLLDRLSDASFRAATRWVVSAIGVTYLVQAARLA
jgi:uncharacterized membrane protein YfcA